MRKLTNSEAHHLLAVSEPRTLLVIAALRLGLTEEPMPPLMAAAEAEEGEERRVV